MYQPISSSGQAVSQCIARDVSKNPPMLIAYLFYLYLSDFFVSTQVHDFKKGLYL